VTRRRPFPLIVLSLLLLFATGLSAQTLDQVIAKNLEAKGGLAAIRSVKSARMVGKMSTQGIDMPFEVEWKRPNKVRSEFTMQGMTGIQAYDGKNAWMIMPFTGNSDPQPIPSEQVKSVAEMADFDGPLVDWQKKGHKAELLGKEMVEGTQAFKIRLTLASGDVQTIYIDADQYLEIKQDVKAKYGDQEIEAETLIGGYKKVGPLVLAHSMETRVRGSEGSRTITFDEIALDVPLDDSVFEMPAKAATPPAPVAQP